MKRKQNREKGWATRLSVLHQTGTTTLDGANYTADDAGNRKTKANLLNSTTDTYSYDDIYQLTQVVQTLNGTSNTTESYTFDKVGNRLSSLALSPYSYNSSNHLTSTPAATFTYDNNGNMLTKADANGTTHYAWDFENRLTSVTLPNASVVSFQYDPFGRRIQKSSVSATVNYVYDGANVVEELNSAGIATARYFQGAGIDEPLARSVGGLYFYEADGLGSITSLTDSTGIAVATYTYDAFGNSTASTGSVANPYRYTAREYDAETGLYYYRARYYDPTIGRFLNEDPSRFTADDSNFYRYVVNNPASYVDPYGLDCRTWVFLVRCNTNGEPASLVAAERAHERQHVNDNILLSWAGLVGLSTARIPQVCMKLESRGYAKEIPILEKRIKELKEKKDLCKEEKEELTRLEEELSAATDVATSSASQREYCRAVLGY